MSGKMGGIMPADYVEGSDSPNRSRHGGRRMRTRAPLLIHPGLTKDFGASVKTAVAKIGDSG